MHNAKELQEILNRIMQGIVSVITSALKFMYFELILGTVTLGLISGNSRPIVVLA